MKILVLSDSHAALSFMRLCIEKLRPDQMIHLGDYYDDGTAMAEEYPQIPMHQVPGNCDKYRCPAFVPQTQMQTIGGVRLLMTHGHHHYVKQDTGRLLADARAACADGVLYGHIHVANCYQEPDGLWVLNPGSCGYYGGSAGLIQVEKGKIVTCRVLRQEDLEELV